MWDKKYSPVAPRTRFLLFLRFRLIDPPSVRRPKLPSRRMPKRISGSSAWRITVDEDLGQRRLNVGQLPMRISHRTVRFSPLSGGGVARCASAHDRARDLQNTSAHTSAALCMPHSMCDVPQHRPGLLAQCVMHRDESCDDEAHYIDAHDARNEAHELKSRLSPQGSPQMMPASALRAQEASSSDIQRSSDATLRERTASFDFLLAQMRPCAPDSPHAPGPESNP